MFWEKIDKKIYLIGILIFLLSCQKSGLNKQYDFLFPKNELKKGVVSKYYVHNIPLNPNEKTKTDISYSLYLQLNDSVFTISSYNAGFQPVQYQEFIQKEKGLILSNEISIYRGDSITSTIGKNNLFLAKDQQIEPLKIDKKFGNITYRYLRKIDIIKDTTFNNNEAKVLIGSLKITLPDLDSTISTIPFRFIYDKSLGLVFSTLERKNFGVKNELVEQMPISKFKQLANHHKKRTGYINPSKTLDQNSNFSLCGKELDITDYYNSDPDGGFFPDKRDFLSSFRQNVDTALFEDVSGYLTFRFVINCKGEAGRFTTEMASLDFKPADFPKNLVQNLFDFLKNRKEWATTDLNEKATDTYFYVTFKFNNGKLENILP